MKYRGKFIVLEGLSGNTKSTQLTLLANRLNQMRVRKPMRFYKFPQYQQDVVGKLILDYLHGDFGDPATMHPKMASLPFFIDRLRTAPEIYHALKDGALVLADRWWPTNAAYQGAKLPKEQRPAFWQWLVSYELGGCSLLVEDIGIYLRTTAAASLELIAKRKAATGEGRDGHEKDDQSQHDRFDCYEALLTDRRNWHTVECLDASGSMRSREEIHEDIWRALKDLL